MSSIERPPDPVEIELANDTLSLRLLDIGAALRDVRPVGGTTPGDTPLALGLPHPLDHLENPYYIGVTAGPVANRIGGASFTIDGVDHRLEPNEGPNQLHGGRTGFSHRRWDVETIPDPDDDGAIREVRFSLHRPDGQGGYPGNLDVLVTYRLDGNRLRYQWTATTDAPTPVSLTNHAYWNLSDFATIADHELAVPADRIVEVDADSIPTGRLPTVVDTDLDLRAPTLLGSVIERRGGNGIDHCYLLNDTDDGIATGESVIVLSHPPSGRQLQITTTLPGVQVYTGQFLDGSDRAGGHARHAGVCLETQHLPDAVNQPSFPDCVVQPGTPVTHTTDYLFVL